MSSLLPLFALIARSAGISPFPGRIPLPPPRLLPFLPLLAFMGLVVGMFAFLAWPAYAKDAGEQAQARSNVGAETTDHFHLWTATMTVGKSSTGTS